MTYNKPNIEVLGKAESVIQSGKTVPSPTDAPDNLLITPAYDLDE